MNERILIVSPEMHEQGGIASVIKTYFDNNLEDGNVIYLSSYKTKNPLGEFVGIADCNLLFFGSNFYQILFLMET